MLHSAVPGERDIESRTESLIRDVVTSNVDGVPDSHAARLAYGILKGDDLAGGEGCGGVVLAAANLIAEGRGTRAGSDPLGRAQCSRGDEEDRYSQGRRSRCLLGRGIRSVQSRGGRGRRRPCRHRSVNGEVHGTRLGLESVGATRE